MSVPPLNLPEKERKEFMRMVEKSSTEILNAAAKAQDDRAKSRDTPEGERSMRRCVEAFNALEGTNLTEAQGWRFMVVLKAARATAGQFNLDDYVDGASYFALAGEAAAKVPRQPMSQEEIAQRCEDKALEAFGEDALAVKRRREFRDAPERQKPKTEAVFRMRLVDAGRLLDVLGEHDDCGPPGAGYKSEGLQNLIGLLEAQFDAQ